MNNSTLELSFALKEAIRNDERSLAVAALEKKLVDDEKVIVLSNDMKAVAEEYAKKMDILPKDDPVLLKLRHELYEKKKALDEYPLCLEYTLAFSKLNDLYFLIESILNEGYPKKRKVCR